MIVVVISAGAEWIAVKKRYKNIELFSSPFGEWFKTDIENCSVIFFYGGWGKISSAASAQYIIDNFDPSVLINIGTCGGFKGKVVVGDIVLAEKTVVYDIYEKMRNSKEDIEFYSTDIDLSWLKESFSFKPIKHVIVSADADIDPDMVNFLSSEYGAVVGDWESASIAYVCRLNKIKCLILRGVSDLVSDTEGEIYGNHDLFRIKAEYVMNKFIDYIPEITANCIKNILK